MARKLKVANDKSRKQSADDKGRILSAGDKEALELYDLAYRLKELAPWRWMEETDLIGIESPETGEIGFISVMGKNGEYEAVALYLGAEGLYGFIDLHEDDASADGVLQVPHVQAAFSERKYLEKQDRDAIKQLGLKISGTGAWPIFRSYRPGYFPWFVTIAEARFLIHALSQILDVAKRVRDEAEPFRPTGRVEADGYLMRVSQKTEAGLVWEDQVWRVPRPKPEAIKATVDTDRLDQLKLIQRSDFEVEADLFLAPGRIGKKDERPLVLYIFMVADRKSGFILGADALTAQVSLSAMHAQVPNSLANILLQGRTVPKTLLVRSELLRGLLKLLTQSLNIELRHTNHLPSIDEATEALHESMRGGKN